MNLINQLKLKLENIEKVAVHIENDCPLGQLYDFACALHAFVLQKMNESKPQQPENVDPQPAE